MIHHETVTRLAGKFACKGICFFFGLFITLSLLGCCDPLREPPLADNDLIVGAWFQKDVDPVKSIHVSKTGAVTSEDFPCFYFFTKDWNFKTSNIYWLAADYDPPGTQTIEDGWILTKQRNGYSGRKLDETTDTLIIHGCGVDYSTLAVLDNDTRLVVFQENAPSRSDVSVIVDGVNQGQTIEEIAAKNAFVIDYVFTKGDVASSQNITK
jgi:hypothetical protein